MVEIRVALPASVAVIGAVQSWLVVQSVASAELSLGDRSYTVVLPRVVAQSGWEA